MSICRGCGNDLPVEFRKLGQHPGCVDVVAEQVKDEITAIIRWASASSPRSLQTSIGPSELGTPCERRLAYRIAGVEPVNTNIDPLISVVGTGLHSWLEAAITRFNFTFDTDTLVPEARVQIDQDTSGTSDLYHRQLQAVIDFKSAGPDVIKQVMNSGPDRSYLVQAHLYGLGYRNQGLPVSHVMNVYLPRSGLLSGIYVWRAPYDEQVALDALARRDRIAAETALAVLKSPNWPNLIPAEASDKDCYFCPFHGKDMMVGATVTYGCPGVTKM